MLRAVTIVMVIYHSTYMKKWRHHYREGIGMNGSLPQFFKSVTIIPVNFLRKCDCVGVVQRLQGCNPPRFFFFFF